MRYKLGTDIAESVPFDPALYERGAAKVMFDEVEVEDISEDRWLTDKTFFCIDVEGTHNFVTAGGVVHNCRPPGNRDPQPEEIASCESHLFRQIELIHPKVICTLGNFATKLLSGKPDGITKVHGREQEVVLGGTRVLLFPIFHPAAALYTPRMLDVLQADFQNLPALLGREPVAPEPPAAQSAAPRIEAVAEPAVQLGLF